ncbi:Uu.00g057480.m01.CDS01 [Anthostomella pinea]|uniref:Uu.00g057480.m01.CDS01 n=1 Tax=Anthostomella pinea TaxID=933095 RepID=A0AAI8VRR3_9PEZI|nr:Uu.00g057480.m01.CDS01 [Anthostomella pinea]
MSDMNKKRKLENAQHPSFGMPEPKHIKKEATGRGKPSEVIVIDDDDDSETKPMLHNNQDVKNLKTTVRRQEDSIRDVRNTSENLRDQITEWSLRAQQLESSNTALNVKEHESLAKRLEAVEEQINKRDFLSDVFDKDAIGMGRQDYHDPRGRFQGLESSASEDKKPAVSSAADMKSGITSSGLPMAIQPSITQLGLAEEHYKSMPTLTNCGLEKILNKVDFFNTDHLRALMELDKREELRDSILMCDNHTFPKFRVNYILKGAKLEERGLGKLRVLELAIIQFPGDPEDQFAMKKPVPPPRYVYDLGQLFLRRKGLDRFDIHGTMFNIVIDIAKPQKPIWLVMRPEYTPGSQVRKDRESTYPFQTHTHFMNGVALARLTANTSDLSLTQAPFSFGSESAFYQAQHSVTNTSYKGQLRFRTPVYDEMMQVIATGWSKK